MKAQKVNHFMRGNNNPYKSLGIGKYTQLKKGDWIKINTNLYALDDSNWTEDINLSKEYLITLNKGFITTIRSVDNNNVLINMNDYSEYASIKLDLFKNSNWFERISTQRGSRTLKT